LRNTWYSTYKTHEQIENNVENVPDTDGFPEITWVGKGFYRSVHTATTTPILFIIVWMAIAVIALVHIGFVTGVVGSIVVVSLGGWLVWHMIHTIIAKT
jgi:hypothetical protein